MSVVKLQVHVHYVFAHAKSQIFTSARDRLHLDRDERVTARPQRRRQRE